ncbi:MAG: TonB-dependent receptor plug domain-containing protein, partial [Rikenellaceae bacterium]|nr:TonB-dependent receptor plug domain-containing protein [Rikenellaceae bacterium]
MLAGAFLGMGTVYAARTDAAGVEILLQDQKSTVSGKVVDMSGQPVIGATVLIKGTTNGSITGVDGSFSVDVKRGDVIEVSFIGYKTAEIVYEGQPSLDITLNEDALNVEEVVVTSMGIKRDTKALGYAIQEVNGDALVQSRDVNVTNALSGKVAGLQVVRGGGSTGSSKIILRGQTSLTGSNQPLIVVDGVPMDNFVGGNTDIWGNQGMDMGNGLADLNPEDIESMSVLKGGSAAALYGSRAGNGVILITTKQGKVNKGLGITVSAGVSIENILVKPELQDNFSQGSRGSLDVLTSSSSWGAPIDGRQYTNWAGQQENLQAYDNISNFFRTGIIDNESVTFQQQINKTSVYSSITRMHDKSMVPGTNLDRISISSRATTNLGEGDKWKLDVKANYINSKAQNRPLQGINNSNMFYTMDLFPR